MPKLTSAQALTVQALQPRGAWLRIGPGYYGNQVCTLMRSATEEVETLDIRVFRALLKLGVIYKSATIQTEYQKHARERYILKREYRNDQDHH